MPHLQSQTCSYIFQTHSDKLGYFSSALLESFWVIHECLLRLIQHYWSIWTGMEGMCSSDEYKPLHACVYEGYSLICLSVELRQGWQSQKTSIYLPHNCFSFTEIIFPALKRK